MNIFITGSSRGLGKALADWYLELEEVVYGLGRTEIEYPNYHYRQTDLSEFSDLKKELESLFYEVRHLDLVILNAAILGRVQNMSACSVESLQHQMDVNMWGNKVILDFFIHRGIGVKQVVAISSGASINGTLGWNGYTLSKGALNMMIELYAQEMKNTHLTSLAPGLIRTEMLENILTGDHDTLNYTSVQHLQESEKAGLVMTPQEAVKQIVTILPRLLEKPSGAYVDIGELQ